MIKNINIFKLLINDLPVFNFRIIHISKKYIFIY